MAVLGRDYDSVVVRAVLGDQLRDATMLSVDPENGVVGVCDAGNARLIMLTPNLSLRKATPEEVMDDPSLKFIDFKALVRKAAYPAYELPPRVDPALANMPTMPDWEWEEEEQEPALEGIQEGDEESASSDSDGPEEAQEAQEPQQPQEPTGPDPEQGGRWDRVPWEWNDFNFVGRPPEKPVSLTMGPYGVLALADHALSQVCIYRSGNGVRVRDVGSGEMGEGPDDLRMPRNALFSLDGEMIVCDTGNHRLSVLSAMGDSVFQFGQRGRYPGCFNEPRDLALHWPEGMIDWQRQIAVADTGNHRIVILLYDHRLRVLQWHGQVGKRGSTPGRFRRPTSVAYSRQGDLVVADSGNSRVQVFNPLGQFTCVLGDGRFGFSSPTSVRFYWPDDSLLVLSGAGSEVHWLSPVPIEDCGFWSGLPLHFELRALGFLSYGDILVARVSCRRAYRTARRLRAEWRVRPLRMDRLEIAKQAWLDWARTLEGQPLPDREPRDAAGAEVCRDFLDNKCKRLYCRHSHEWPVVRHDIAEAGVVTFDEGFHCIIAQRYGLRFWWANEFRLLAVFNEKARVVANLRAFATDHRSLDVVRRSELKQARVIVFEDYLRIITAVEECALGLQLWDDHPAVRDLPRKPLVRGVGMNEREVLEVMIEYQAARLAHRIQTVA